MTDQPMYVELPPFYMNQSRWKVYQDCDRLYGWYHIENLVPDRPRKALEIGTAIHVAQEIAHGGVYKDGVEVIAPRSEEAFHYAMKAAEQTFRKGMSTGPKLPGDEAEILDGVRVISKLLPAYYEHYKGEDQLWKPLGTELSFCVEVGEGSNVFLVGRIDNLVTFMDGLWLVDYKTMGKLDMREFLKYEIDVQPTAYIYGGTKKLSLEAMARGEPPVRIRGVIIDGMVKTAVPQFHREIYTRSLDDLREFELEFVEKAREIATKHLRVANGENWKTVFPKNTQHCFRYGTCAFRDLCIRDNETRRAAYRDRDQDYVDAARAGG